MRVTLISVLAYLLPMNDILSLTPAQLNRAADLKEEIIKLEQELSLLLGSGSMPAGKRKPGRPKKGIVPDALDKPKTKRRKMSAVARAKMAAAAKARWAKAKAGGKN